jgi:hypothetical protein
VSQNTPSQLCPDCGKELNAITIIFGKPVAPTPGDISICAYCASVLVFDADLKQRAARKEDLDQLDSETLNAIYKARRAVHNFHVARN